MFNNKTGINDAKIGQNDNTDLGNNKNNKDQEKTLIKNSELENSNNKQIFENNQNLYNAATMNNYYINKAKEDSKNDQVLKIIELKTESLEKIYKIKNTYINCQECRQKYQKEYSKITENLINQHQLKGEFGILDDKAWDYSIIPFDRLPSMYGNPFEQTLNFENQQKIYFTNFKLMKPGYFTPCINHIKLSQEWETLEMKINDYENLIKNNPN